MWAPGNGQGLGRAGDGAVEARRPPGLVGLRKVACACVMYMEGLCVCKWYVRRKKEVPSMHRQADLMMQGGEEAGHLGPSISVRLTPSQHTPQAQAQLYEVWAAN